MTNTQRRFIDAPNDVRCKADIRLRDGSGAQCGRRATAGEYCWQHSRAARSSSSPSTTGGET
jgi:hypothetical protein